MNNKITAYAITFDSKLLLFNLNFGTNKNNTSSKIITVTSNVNKMGPQVNEIRSGLLNANTDKSKTRARVVTIADMIILLSEKNIYIFFFLCLLALKRFLRLCVFILRFFRFLPQGINSSIIF